MPLVLMLVAVPLRPVPSCSVTGEPSGVPSTKNETEPVASDPPLGGQ